MHSRILLNLTGLALLLLINFTQQLNANEPQMKVRCGPTFLEVLDSAQEFQPFYAKGVNLSGVLPGHQATDPCTDPTTYARWFGLLTEMNCNTVRVFNTMPDAFYSALAEHNAMHPGVELWLIQGIWVELPLDDDFFGAEFINQVEGDINRAIDAVNGSGGTDVSEWVLAYLFGREWEAPSVRAFNQLHPEQEDFVGTYIATIAASPMEAWLAKMCDGLVAYEHQTYGWQHPVSFINWVATDPINHREGYRQALGEDFTIPARALEDFQVNDSVSLTVNKLTAKQAFKAGLYASYHVYPYYPDFIANQPQYADVMDSQGNNSFLGYLRDLKSNYPTTPLLITEYGLASSSLAVHQQPQGWNHGGMSEKQVAEVLPRLTKAVATSGCAGGAVFSWTDGWFKRVWLWNRFYRPADESTWWFNLLDPEQNYGLLALEPESENNSKLAGQDQDWKHATLLTPLADPGAHEPVILAMHDEGYLYLRIELPDYDDWQFETHRLQIGLNVDSDDTGNYSFPAPVKLDSDEGMELMVVLSRGEARLYQASTFRFWAALKRWNGILALKSKKLAFEKNSYGWILPQVQTNSPVLSKTGEVIEAQAWPLNPLKQGSLLDGKGFEPHATWNVSPATSMLELRIPWMMAGFTAPHRRHVLVLDENQQVGFTVSDGVGVSVVLSDVAGKLKRHTKGTKYAWDWWDSADISFSERLKPAYYAMQQVYAELDSN